MKQSLRCSLRTSRHLRSSRRKAPGLNHASDLPPHPHSQAPAGAAHGDDSDDDGEGDMVATFDSRRALCGAEG